PLNGAPDPPAPFGAGGPRRRRVPPKPDTNLPMTTSAVEPVVYRGPDASDLLGAMPEKFSDVLRGWAERAPRLTALYFREDAISYGELWRLVRAAAEWLRTQGVGPGDKVMIVGENGPQ